MIETRTKEQIATNLIAQIIDKYPTAEVEVGSMIRDVNVDPQSIISEQFYTAAVNIDMLNAYAANAENIPEDWLDNKLSDFGSQRKSAKFSTVRITFRATSLPTSIITIGNVDGSGGISIKTLQTDNGTSYEFITIKTVYLQPDTPLAASGFYEVSADAIATLSGTSSNVGVGTITVLGTTIDGISSCYNYIAATGGEEKQGNLDFVNDTIKLIQGGTSSLEAGIYNITNNIDNVNEIRIIGPNSGDLTDNSDSESSPSGKVYVFIKGSILTQHVQTFEYDSSNLYYVLEKRPVNEILSVQAMVNGVQTTLIKNVDYSFQEDVDSDYSGSNKSVDIIFFMSDAVNVPDSGSTFTVNYSYNSLIEDIYNQLQAASKSLLLLGEIIVKKSTPIYIIFSASMKLKYGSNSEDYQNTILTAISKYIISKKMGDDLKASEVYDYLIQNHSDIIESINYPFTKFNTQNNEDQDTVLTNIGVVYGEYTSVNENSLDITFQ